MSAQHHALTQAALPHNALAHNTGGRSPAESAGLASSGRGHEPPAGLGGGALTRAVERWRRALLHDHAHAAPTGSTPGPSAGNVGAPAGDADGLATLTRRLDDSGCSYGRVSAARLDSVTRAYDRLETKMNAVLMAVTGTFLSTLAGLLLYYVRGGGQ